MNTNKIATGSTNKKLLAALAVLAVAIVALAAIPAVADTDSDAAASTVYVDSASTATSPTGTASSAYQKLEDALAAVDAGSIIMLNSDLDVSSVITIDKAITINGQGHKITAKGISTTSQDDAALFKIANSTTGTVAFRNVSLVSTTDFQGKQ